MEDFPRLQLDDTFRFACHRGIACFNECCRDLNQFLTPYDVLRLKGALKMPSDAFLKRYTACHRGPQTGLPVVSLKPEPGADLACPFVAAEGCRVYKDRPGSCRTYPLGRVAVREPGHSDCGDFYFLIEEPHCLGFREPREQTVRAWVQDQELSIYNEMNDLVMDVISLNNRRRHHKPTEAATGLFYMVFYDLDRFKERALAGDLRPSFSMEQDMVSATTTGDETVVLRLALAWLKDAAFGRA